MSSTATSKRNGKTAAPVCRHSPGCEVVSEQRDLRVIVEAIRTEQLELRNLIQSSLMRLHEDVDHDRAKFIDAFEGLRSDARATGDLVRALTKVLETRPCLVSAGCGQEG